MVRIFDGEFEIDRPDGSELGTVVSLRFHPPDDGTADSA
jgi:hypothetical protein